jgi:hypothetical protein
MPMTNSRPIESLRHKRPFLRLSLGVVAGFVAVMGFAFPATALAGKEDRSPAVTIRVYNHTQASTDTRAGARREAGRVLGEVGVAFDLEHRKFHWEQPAVARVTVAIYDDVRLSPRVLADAEDQAARVFQKAGVVISWIECKSSKTDAEPDLRCQDPPSIMRLNLRIVPHASKASDGVFGVAFLSAEGTGAYSDVSYNSVVELDREWHVGLAQVLGHVMAHELGHLLLGSNAHSRQGIMCPRWHGDELHLASKGALLFSEEQGRFMRERLAR